MSVEVGAGVTGLIGPNGAGKTTLLSCVATVLEVPAGRVFVGGHDVGTRVGREAARRLLGFLPQRFDLVGSMRAVDTVAYAAWACGVDRAECKEAAERALAEVGISHLAGARVRTLSGGQRQRLGIAAAIAHDPQVLLLDEPTVGLDPESRVRIREHIAGLGRDRVVVLSTHAIEDVARVSDRLLVLHGGRLVFDGPTSELARAGEGEESSLLSPLEVGYERLLSRGGE